MFLEKVKKCLTAFFLSGILAGEITVLLDLLVSWLGMDPQRIHFLCCFGGMLLVWLVLPGLTNKRRTAAAIGIPAAILTVCVAGFLFWRSFSQNAAYQDADKGKEQLYANRQVMLIVPHQDDEINVLGGVMEEYVKYGSTVYPVFVTNGDYETPAQTRVQEALDVAQHIGIPAENVIFLGYGDQWAEGSPHIYNAAPGETVTSYAGKNQTYGTAAHSVFREGRAYTAENLLEDMEAVILQYRPDVIFCSDYDSHIDHKAVSLAFDKVMGRILKAQPDYRPLVFKGYAYKTAWYAEADFYETNILSTANVFEDPYWQRPAVYRWEDRVRFPVKADTLSRSVYSSDTYYTLKLHESQNAFTQAGRVINGDRVLWQRPTESLCYAAEVEASSGAAELLNDFMLIDNRNLVDEQHKPYDGTWIPEGDDTQRRVAVTFTEPKDISCIVLYDHPAEDQNVLDAIIRFDDGTGVNTGRLDPGGAATRITVEKQSVRSFVVILCETEGEQAGLTEIEAFQEIPEADFRYLKLMDAEGNFVYDYWTGTAGKAEFRLHTYGGAACDTVQVTTDRDTCDAVWENGSIKVTCPRGEAAVVTVTCPETGAADSVYVRNPDLWQRLQCSIGQKLEEVIAQGYFDTRYCNSVTYELFDILRYRLEQLL